MAIANYEALNELLKERDYNVRVTIGNSQNKSDTAFLELIRDSLGCGIIHSKDIMIFKVTRVDELGQISSTGLQLKGEEIMDYLSADLWVKDTVATRIDKFTKTRKEKTWIIVR